MAQIKIQLPANLESRLKYLALVSKQPKSFYIKEALIRYLEDIEDIKDTLDSIEENHGQKTYTTEEVLKILEVNYPHSGKPLHGELKGYRRCRYDDYRIVYQIIEEEILISIIKVGHRREIY